MSTLRVPADLPRAMRLLARSSTCMVGRSSQLPIIETIRREPRIVRAAGRHRWESSIYRNLRRPSRQHDDTRVVTSTPTVTPLGRKWAEHCCSTSWRPCDAGAQARAGPTWDSACASCRSRPRPRTAADEPGRRDRRRRSQRVPPPEGAGSPCPTTGPGLRSRGRDESPETPAR